jgi:hypothetical protein
VLVAAAMWGCSVSSAGQNDASDEHSLTGSNPEAGEGDASDASALTLTTTLRLAQLSRDLGPIDVCYRASSAQTFSGPIFSSQPVPIDAGVGVGDGGLVDAAIDSPSLDSSVAVPDAGPTDATIQDSTVTDSPAPDATSPDAASFDAGPSDAGTAEVGADSGPAITDAAVGDATTEAGASSGLAYLQVSNYVTIQGAGTFDIVVVSAGQGSCTSPIVDRKLTLDDGKRTTLALFGSAALEAGANGALDMIAMVDDPSVVAGETRTRFFDSARLLADVGLPESPEPLLVSVIGMPTLDLATIVLGAAPGPSSNAPTQDALGYHTDVPVSGLSRLRIERAPAADGPDGSTEAGAALWLSSPQDLHLDPGSIHTGFVVGNPAGDLATLWCDDTSFGSAASACTLLLE